MKYWIKRYDTEIIKLNLKISKIKTELDCVKALREYYTFCISHNAKIDKFDCPFCYFYSSCAKCTWKDYAKKYPEEFKLDTPKRREVCLNWKKKTYSYIDVYPEKDRTQQLEFFVNCLKRLDKMEKIIKEKGGKKC